MHRETDRSDVQTLRYREAELLLTMGFRRYECFAGCRLSHQIHLSESLLDVLVNFRRPVLDGLAADGRENPV